MRYPDYYSPPAKAQAGCGVLMVRILWLVLAVFAIVKIWKVLR